MSIPFDLLDLSPNTSILVANRGEIACRVMRTAKSMGLRTVAVYSDADANALHVRTADTALCLGPAPAADSYLRGDLVLAAAKASGAQMIHPGYGFLSENANFADSCAGAGIIFVGPPAAAIRAMGSKSEAKKLMGAAGVPLTPGYHGDDQSDSRLQAEANAIGYPVLIKAAAGGGGKGMRAVQAAADFPAALASCRRESQASFADDHMLVEKLIQRPRHVEVQVFCDSHGQAVYLFERDCSVQRRHQKVLEEAPAPGMTADLRQRMGAAAVAAAQAVAYVGAGTVEFLLDAAGQFYFMEMNTRLQVEHPVTELITGQDLVAWQLHVAAGGHLPCSQDDLTLTGHAIEARIYAEDPGNNFMPATGTLTSLQLPDHLPGVRVDTGVASGDSISAHYDPMIAKLVVQGRNRGQALQRLDAALAAWRMQGVHNNINFLRQVVASAAFASGAVHTGLLADLGEQILQPTTAVIEDAVRVAVVAQAARRLAESASGAGSGQDPWSPWGCADGYRVSGPATEVLQVAGRDRQWQVRLTSHSPGQWLVQLTDSAAAPGGDDPGQLLQARWRAGGVVLVQDQQRRDIDVLIAGQHLVVFLDTAAVDLVLSGSSAERAAGASAATGFAAPMTGKVVANLVAVADQVAAGAALVVMEAMKMEYTITAPVAGSVDSFHYAPGDQVAEGADLLAFSAAPD